MRNPPRILCLTVAQRRAPSGRGQIARPTQPHRFAFRLAFEMARAVRARANSHEKLRPQFLDSSRSEPSEQNARRFSSAREATFELGALLRRVDSRRANLQPFRVATIESADHTDTLNARGSRIEARGASSRERASPSRGVRAAHRASRRGSRAVFSFSFSERCAGPLRVSATRFARAEPDPPRSPLPRAERKDGSDAHVQADPRR